eukprot:CAMPEP_0170589492 /NCGR_PEP_ID=MMETSP0224-20130122/11377_1 /TAXON_ID=285029 /ORGANISM="Togula jolla, Strain CCCM 725" /LENGTH=233 /DNA_ID=CAMNT_0010913249 /DNA_START=354 /DNA_END=1056 /DNA_ORIENTATION=+
MLSVLDSACARFVPLGKVVLKSLDSRGRQIQWNLTVLLDEALAPVPLPEEATNPLCCAEIHECEALAASCAEVARHVAEVESAPETTAVHLLNEGFQAERRWQVAHHHSSCLLACSCETRREVPHGIAVEPLSGRPVAPAMEEVGDSVELVRVQAFVEAVSVAVPQATIDSALCCLCCFLAPVVAVAAPVCLQLCRKGYPDFRRVGKCSCSEGLSELSNESLQHVDLAVLMLC